MIETRIHNCREVFGSDYDMFRIYQAKYTFKPSGLWYSVGNSWLDWCKKFFPDNLGKCNYSVQIGFAAKMLCLNSNTDIIQFHYRYKRKARNNKFAGIDWTKVMKEYDGIEITPYGDISNILVSEGFNWHSEWCASSGCVWNLAHVKINYLTKQNVEISA